MGDKVLICYVHSGEQVAYSWHESMLQMSFHFVASKHFGARLPIRYGTGGLVEARNTAVDRFLSQDECDWLFWVDTDMGFEPDVIDRLMASADADERPVMGALCFINHATRDDGFGGSVTSAKPSLFMWAKNPDGRTGFVPDVHYQRNSVVRCDGTGAACIIIHRSVFEAIRDKNGGNYYGHMVNPDNGDIFSEDLSFCVRLAECEIPIHVDTSVQTTHYKPVWLSERHLDMLTLAAQAEATEE